MPSISSPETLLLLPPPTFSLGLLQQLPCHHLVYRSTGTSWTMCSRPRVREPRSSTTGSPLKMFSRSCVNPKLSSGYGASDGAALL